MKVAYCFLALLMISALVSSSEVREHEEEEEEHEEEEHEEYQYGGETYYGKWKKSPQFGFYTTGSTGQYLEYSVNTATGLGNAAGAKVAGSSADYLTIFGHWLIVADATGSHIAVFSINGTTGATSNVFNYFTASDPSALKPNFLSVHPSGRFLFAAETAAGKVATYRFKDDYPGQFVYSGVTTYTGFTSLSWHPNGRVAYIQTIVATTVTVTPYTFSSGTLTATANTVAYTNVAAGGCSSSIDYEGELYVAICASGTAANNGIFANKVSKNGQFPTVAVQGTTLITAGVSYFGFALVEHNVYFTLSGSINVAKLNEHTGSGTFLTAVAIPGATVGNPVFISADPSGRFVYATVPASVGGFHTEVFRRYEGGGLKAIGFWIAKAAAGPWITNF